MTIQQMETVEMGVAEELLESLGPEAAEVQHEDDRAIHFKLRKRGWSLSKLVLSKSSLRLLASDDQKSTKLEYLLRDITRTARARTSYCYPRQLCFGS